MNTIHRCFCIFFLGLFLALQPVYGKDKQPPIIITVAGLQVVQEAQQVQPLRVTGYPHGKDSVEGQTIDGYEITAAGEPQGNEYTQRLAKVIAAEAIKTGHEYQSACIFSPAIAYQFRGEAETVDVLVCFHCYGMLIVERDASGKIIHEAFTNFSNSSRNALVHLAKLAFPGDTELQALK